MPICNLCTVTFDKLDVDLERLGRPVGIMVDHHSGIASFVQSADHKCYLCSQAFETFSPQCQNLMRQLVDSLPVPEESAVRRVHDDYKTIMQDRSLFFTRLYLHLGDNDAILRVHVLFYKEFKDRLVAQGLFDAHVASSWAALAPELPLGDFNFSYAFVRESRESDFQVSVRHLIYDVMC